MGGDIVNNYIIYNGGALKADEFDYGKTSLFPGIYEVLRVIDGVPLFMEKHMSRFRSSAAILGYEILQKDDYIVDLMYKLIELNKCHCGNIKIVINNLDKPEQDHYLFFVKSKYPSQDEIENGVPTILFYGERNNPNAKTTDLSIREKINQEISKYKAYEALLVNKNSEITEGSKSNIFAVKGESISTSPAKDVLPGVTRGYIIDICKGLGLSFKETPVDVRQLPEMDGLFITGTSPQVLPISSVDGVKLSSATNDIIRKIRGAYMDLVRDYISEHK